MTNRPIILIYPCKDGYEVRDDHGQWRRFKDYDVACKYACARARWQRLDYGVTPRVLTTSVGIGT